MKNWEIKKLGEVSKFQGGSQPPKSQFISEYREGYVRFLQIRDFKSDKHIVYIPVSTKNRLCNKTDIMIGRYGASVGQILRGKEGAYNVALIKSTPNEKIIDHNFFFLYLNSSLFQQTLMLVSDRSAQAGFSKEDISLFDVPLPPLSEQKQIVSIVDEAFEAIDIAIDNTKQNLTNARELFDSYLNAIFTQKGDGWVNKRLGDISEVQSGGTPLRSKNEYWGGSLAWYSSGELNDLYTSVPERNVTELGLKNSNAKSFPKGSLLIGMYDTAALKMSILDREAAFNQAIAGVKPNSEIDLTFILHAINSVKPELLNLRRGVRQKNLSLQKIKDIVLAVPELQEQQLVVRQLACMSKETQRLEAIYRQKLAALNELKQSILHKAFTGELTADKADLKINIDREAIAV